MLFNVSVTAQDPVLVCTFVTHSGVTSSKQGASVLQAIYTSLSLHQVLI